MKPVQFSPLAENDLIEIGLYIARDNPKRAHSFLAELDANAALDLVEAFIDSDHAFFERADDSDGDIGDAIRSACQRWLQAAAQCRDEEHDWVGRIYALDRADEYGAREEPLRAADRLLDEPALRALAARFQQDLDAALNSGARTRPPTRAVFKASAAVSLVAEALRDPDLST